ncbi:MAG: signal recognition particle-docking protein FtsY [Candidatus Aenigmatarchaeota archaeon]
MFGFLKKKLKESVEKIASAIRGEDGQKAEEHLAEQIEEAKPVPVEPAPVEVEAKAGATELPIEEELVPEETVQEVPPEVKKEIVKDVKEAVAEHAAEQKPKRGLFERLKKAITEKEIEEKDVLPVLGDIQTGLLESDVALEVAEKIVNDLKSALVGKSISRGQVESTIRESLRKSVYEILNQPDVDIFELVKTKKPLKVIFLGFNGTGKTTTIARLGYMLKEKGLSPLFAAADTWRAAAQEQIEIHGEKLGIPVVKHKYGADPAAVIFDAVKAAESRKLDIVLADTAGRSHSNAGLMDEMKKIIRVNKPDLKILVVDCLTGNDAVEQARTFNAAVGVDGVILTKADVYEKGGAVLSTAWAIKKPILYIGVGQDYKDLQKFDAKKVADGLLG